MRKYDQDIPIGIENAISRADLAKMWGVDQRVARAIVHELRTVDNGDPYVIVSSSNGRSGYYRTDDPYLIHRFIRETRSRAANTYASLKKARRVLEDFSARA